MLHTHWWTLSPLTTGKRMIHGTALLEDAQLDSWLEYDVSILVHSVFQKLKYTICLTGRSLPIALGSCAFIGATVGVYDYTAGVQGKDDTIDKPKSKEEKRKAFFKQPPAPLIPNSQSPAEV